MLVEERTTARPPLKWAGGKRWQVPHIKPLWEPHANQRLVEPFCGGLAIALGLMPAKALLNDANPHLISFYRRLQKGLAVSMKFENKERPFYKHRDRFNELLTEGKGDTAEAANLFYYLNRTGYNGLCRFNNKGVFNVPFGRYKKIAYRRDFADCVPVFERFEFTTVDFEAIPLAADDFIYADPPYDVEFRQYSKEGFGWEEQVRAARWLGNHAGPVVLSNQATDRIERLYRDLGFSITHLSGPRLISCMADRAPAREVLA